MSASSARTCLPGQPADGSGQLGEQTSDVICLHEGLPHRGHKPLVVPCGSYGAGAIGRPPGKCATSASRVVTDITRTPPSSVASRALVYWPPAHALESDGPCTRAQAVAVPRSPGYEQAIPHMRPRSLCLRVLAATRSPVDAPYAPSSPMMFTGAYPRHTPCTRWRRCDGPPIYRP
jgi:hypothetical protein